MGSEHTMHSVYDSLHGRVHMMVRTRGYMGLQMSLLLTAQAQILQFRETSERWCQQRSTLRTQAVVCYHGIEYTRLA